MKITKYPTKRHIEHRRIQYFNEKRMNRTSSKEVKKKKGKLILKACKYLK